MRRRLSSLVGAVLVLTLLGSGCQQHRVGTWVDQDPRPKTRLEFYGRFGPPDAIRRDGDIRWLRYDSAEGRGMVFGLAYRGARVAIGRQHRANDIVWVAVAPDDSIVDLVAGRNSSNLRYRLWPFGD